MKNKIKLIIICLLVINNIIIAQSNSKIFSEDIIAYGNFVKNHKNLYAHIEKSEFEHRINTLVSKAENLSKEAILIELLKLNALIQDEHTNLFVTNIVEYFPFKFSLFEEGLFITSVQSDSAYVPYLLNKVVSINDVPVDSILNKFKLLVKQDNPSYALFFYNLYINQTAILKGLGILNNDNIVKLKLINTYTRTEKNVSSSLISSEKVTTWKKSQPEEDLLSNKEKKRYFYYYNQEQKVMYLNYKHCSQDPTDPFESFMELFFKDVNKFNPKKIVVDLRQNTGGNSSLFNPFIKYIASSLWNQKNKLFILIGCATMSSALMNAVDLKHKTKAIFIGEETGGNVNHFGETKSFVLPSLGLKGIYSTKYWEKWPNYVGGLKPDIVVKYKFDDLVKSIDVALQTVYQVDN